MIPRRRSLAWLALSLAGCGGEPRSGHDNLLGTLQAHERFLASEELEGRESLGRGGRVASRYLATRFSAAGLEPAGDEGGYFQTYPIRVPKLGPANALTLTFAGGETQAIPGTDWIPFACSPGKVVEGPVAFAGYGIVNPQNAWDDYAGLDAKGKILVILRHWPREKSKEGPWADPARRGYSPALVTKLKQAAEHGAAGLILVDDPMNHADEPDRLPQSPAEVGRNQQSTIPFVHLTRAAAKRLLGPAGLDLLAEQKAVDEALKPAPRDVQGLRIRLSTDVDTSSEEPSRNVMALLKGSDPALRKEVVVLGAHYDHIGVAPDGRVFCGADDNASGASTVLALAEAMAASPRRPRRSVMFVLFSGEERGLLGSTWQVDHPTTVSSSDMVAMINLDMVGRYQPERFSVGGVGTAAEWKPILDRVLPAHGLAPRYEFHGNAPTDTTSYNRKKIPVLFWFAGFHPDYHKTSDTVEKINFDGMERIARAVREVVLEVADADRRPAYVEVPSPSSRLRLGIAPDDRTNGVGVGALVDGGPAAKAGILPGDLIVEMDHRPVRGLEDLMIELSRHKPGDVVEVTVVREEQHRVLKVAFEAEARSPSPRPYFGITPDDRTDGVGVGALVDGGPAAKAGILPRDLIVEMDHRPVRGLEDLMAEMGRRKPGDVVEVTVVREGRRRVLQVTLTPP